MFDATIILDIDKVAELIAPGSDTPVELFLFPPTLVLKRMEYASVPTLNLCETNF